MNANLMVMRRVVRPAILKGPSVATKEQLAFLEVFETSKPSNPLFCHQEFLEKLAEHGRDSIGRRTAFLMQRLSVGAPPPALQGDSWHQPRMAPITARWQPRQPFLRLVGSQQRASAEGVRRVFRRP